MMTSAMTSDSMIFGTSFYSLVGRSARSRATVANRLRKKRSGRSLADPEVEHPAEDQLVVAGVVDQLDPQSTQARLPSMTGEPWPAPAPVDPVELVAAGDGEAPAQLLLGVGEHVDAEAARPGDPRPAGRRPGRGHGHEGRVDRERDEALAGEARPAALLDAGHDGHPGGEPAHGLLEPGGVERWHRRQRRPRSRFLSSKVPLLAAFTSTSPAAWATWRARLQHGVDLPVGVGRVVVEQVQPPAPASAATCTA